MVSTRTRLACSACGLVVALLVPVQARAQSSGDVGIGYSLTHELAGSLGTGGINYPIGWLTDVSVQPAGSRFSLVGEISGSYRRPAGVLQRLHGFVGGIRIVSRSRRVVPFGQVLAGIEQYSEPGFSELGFAIQPGGGVELPFSPHVVSRAQVDFRAVREQGEFFREFRLSGVLSFKVW